MKTVEIGKVDKLTAEAGSYIGVTLVANLQHTAVNTAFVGLPIDWSNVILTVKLKKKSGEEIPICQDPVLPLVLDSGFLKSQYNQCSSVGSPDQVVYQLQTAGLKAILKQTAFVDFDGAINLDEGDKLMMEVNCLPSAVTSVVDTTVSAIYFDFEEGIGNGFAIPQIKVETLKGGEGTLPVSAGHGVKSISFINNDKSGIAIGNQVLLSCNLSSDKLNRTFQYDEILKYRYRQFETTAEADKRNQSFVLLDVDAESRSAFRDLYLDQCTMLLTFNAANVTAAKNWVVVRKMLKNATVRQQAQARHAKHMQRNAGQYA